jgi:phage-related protein
MKVISVDFFKTSQGREPVREWLLDLSNQDRYLVGTELKVVELGWPLGMPVVRKMESDLWEVRVDISDGIARVLFTVEKGHMVLLHGIVKKSQKTPLPDLKTARKRMKQVLYE